MKNFKAEKCGALIAKFYFDKQWSVQNFKREKKGFEQLAFPHFSLRNFFKMLFRFQPSTRKLKSHFIN